MTIKRTLAVLALGACMDIEDPLELGEVEQALGPTVTLRTHFNPTTGDHYLTALGGQPSGYTQVRLEGRIFSPSAAQPPDTLPLYTWYGAARQDYQTTTDPYWACPTPGMVKNNYQCIRLEGYVHARAVAGALPLQQWWSPTRADNRTTADPTITVDAGALVDPDYDHVQNHGYVLPPTTEQPPATKDRFRWGTMGGSPSGPRGERDLLVITQSCSDLPLQHSNSELDQLAFGPGFPNVRDYTLDNSNNRFAWRRGGVIGPFVYPDDPDTSANESSYSVSFTDGSTNPRIAFAQLRTAFGGKVAARSQAVVATSGSDNQEVFGLHDINGGDLISGDLVAFKTGDNRWLRENAGVVTADATSSTGAARFTIRASVSGAIVDGTQVTLQTASGRFLYEDTALERILATFSLVEGNYFTIEKNCCPDIERMTRAMVSRALAAGYDFHQHDHDNDGSIEPSELSIVIINASPTGRGGASRVVREIPMFTVPALRFGGGLVSAMGENMSFMTLVHELFHQLGTIDLYGNPGPNNGMSTMSATIFGNIDDRRSFMLDPWHRLRLGWMEPEIQAFNATGASNTQLAPDMTGVRPLLIYDPRRYDLDTRTGDYFLVEYRTNGRSGYDQDVSSASVDRTGMAIWQIREGSLIVETFAPDGIGGSQLWDSGDGTITPLYADGTSSPFRLRVGPTSLTSFGATVEWTDDGLLRPRIDGGTTVIRPGQIAILDGMFAVDATGAGARFFNRATGVWTTATLATPWTSSRVLVNVPATLGEGDYLLYLSRSSRESNGHPIEILPPL